MAYDIPGKGMFHTDCKKQPGCGIMKDLHKSNKDEDGTTLHAYECLHCGEIGNYGIQEKTRVIIVKSEILIEQYKERFIKYITDLGIEHHMAESELEGQIEIMGDDPDLSNPEDDACECLTYWEE